MMTTMLKIGAGLVLLLVLIPAAVVRGAENQGLTVHTVRVAGLKGPEVVGLELRLCGHRAFVGMERREPL